MTTPSEDSAEKPAAKKKAAPKRRRRTPPAPTLAPTFADQFRGAAPYINAHRGRTFIITFSGEMVEDPRFPELIQDIALLNSLGIRLVLVHGARPQIEQRLEEFDAKSEVINGLRVTNEDALLCVKESVGTIRIELEGLLSTGLPNSPMSGADIRVASGNLVTARPLGIRDGVDYQHTGEVRRIDVEAIEKLLDNGFIVLLSPLGTSPTGEVFNLSSEDVATSAAIQLKAEKMLALSKGAALLDQNKKPIHELTPDEAEQALEQSKNIPEQTTRHLLSAIHACRQGVPRAHILDSEAHGALLQELFTRDGVGTMVTAERYDEIRQATIDDIGGIIELIQPLEHEGILVPRSRELIEIQIDHYIVMERDGTIIGVAALFPYENEKVAEVAGVAIHPEYQNQGRGKTLLQYIDRRLSRMKGTPIERLFVLSTRTAHWFQELGYEPAKLSDLPVERQSLYNYKRNSKVFIRTLSKAR